VSEFAPSNKTVMVLTALEVETRAVLRHVGSFTDEVVSGTGFFRGQFEGWDVAVAEIGAGNVSAAAIAVRALAHYKPSVALFVGVAGGVKDVAIGDVVVGTKVYGYESGKDRANGFNARPDVMKTAHDLEQRARTLRQRADWRKRLNSAITHEAPAVFVAPIAAGEKVVASKRAATAKLIREHYGDALAVEMEGRGFLEGVHISHPVQGCVVRGISDLLSGKANADEGGLQQRAADAASAVAQGKSTVLCLHCTVLIIIKLKRAFPTPQFQKRHKLGWA
jgi:nucleoside phosphorylase